jgi:outer membrane protein assembly factor BamA
VASPEVGPPQAPSHPRAAPRPTPKDTTDYVTRRFEPAGFPLIGGDSDIGLELGAVGTLSYFADGVRPYRWNMDLLAAISIKQGPNGAEIAQQSYLWNWDLPGLYGGRLRLNPEVSYSHTINYGYFGLGDASSPGIPTGNGNPGRYHEWIESIAQVRSSARIRIAGPLSAQFAAQYLYVAPTAYADSQLAGDSAERQPTGQPLLYGTTALSLPSLAAGFVYDTRDNEIFPHSGMLHELGVRGEEGLPTSGGVHYLETGAILRGYIPLGGPFVAAARLVLNAQVGNVPFYDLFQAGPFDQKEMPGGSAGVRGVPVGRYLGPIKAIGNVELRALWLHFTVLQQKFTLGNDLFFDTGRVWSDYSFHSPLDGSGLGLKYGMGAGIYVLWGAAAMLRIEAAYSPDAVAENPTLPLGIYVDDGIMF